MRDGTIPSVTRTLSPALTFALAVALAPTSARADVTVVYAAPAPRAPLVARPVGPTERSETPALPSPSASPPGVEIAPVPEPAALTAPCPSPRPVALVREGSDERASLALTDCAGRAEPQSQVELSLLARPSTLATRPSARELAEHRTDPEWVAAGIRRLHPGLAERLRAIADQFPGHVIEIVSGFRPDAREGSRHLVGVAIDVRVQGASLDAVHAFVRRFDRTGVGLVRATGVIHLDVRPRSVLWIDESAPGEPARIVEDDARRAGPIVRAPERTLDAPPVAQRSGADRAPDRAPPDRPAPRSSLPSDDVPGDHVPGDEDELDPDAVADEVLRGLGELSLPRGPGR